MRLPAAFIALSAVLSCTTEPPLQGDLHVSVRSFAGPPHPYAGPTDSIWGVPDVPVTLDDIRGADDRMAVTDGNGMVTFPDVEFGSYSVLIPAKLEPFPGDTVYFIGFQGWAGRDIALPPYDTVDLRSYMWRGKSR